MPLISVLEHYALTLVNVFLTVTGYFRSPMERPPTNNIFQTVGQNIVSAGAPVPGDLGSAFYSLSFFWTIQIMTCELNFISYFQAVVVHI